MKTGFLVSLMAFITILGINASARAGISITQVTTNSYEDSSPQIKGDYLVWQGRVGGDWDVFLYNVATGEGPLPITDNAYGDIAPQTDGTYVVWLGFSQPDGDVFLPGGEIFVYNILNGETSQITNDTNVDSPPQIANGRVVWTSHEVTDSVEPGEIFLYDTANETTSRLSASVDPDSLLDDCFPRINGKNVMWVQADDIANTTTVFIHDLSSGSTTQAPQDFVWGDSPQTDGGLTVKARQVGNDREIFVHDSNLKSNEQITDNDCQDRHPSISGNTIVWMGGEGENAEIFLADLCDNRPITGILSPSIATLWPPNHNMVPVTVDASGLETHNPDTQIAITSVSVTEYSEEDAGEDFGENIYDENDFEPDVEITGDLALNLRSERAGASTGRTYTIKVTASDCSGTYIFTAMVLVPHDKRK